MIAVSSSGRSFRALATYLAAGQSGEERDRVAWSAGRNLPTDDPELAATFMRATAAQSDRVEKPVYHVALSFDPNDRVDRATMERVADRVLDRLGLAEHQAVIVAHRDREHAHVHILVNRVHPETGHAWERWKDQPLIQQVLREEELALGLREVAGTLGPPRERELREPAPPASLVDHRSQQHGDRQANGKARRDRSIAPPTRVDEVVHEIRTHERIVELAREQYHAQIDVSAARTRLSQLDAAAERARLASAAFDRALAAVFRDPERAHGEYLEMVERAGVGAAAREMRERPEQFGRLASVERTRAFGIVRGEDDSPARSAAPLAALKGHDAIVALREFGKAAAEMQTRRFEDAFMRELRAIHEEPTTARSTFERLARERGLETAATTLRERPEEFGELRLSIREDPSRLGEHAARAAELGVEAAAARTVAKSADARMLSALIPTAPENVRGDVERALAREAEVRRELAVLPSRAELERRIATLIDRMSPHEVRQLRRTVTAPRFALAMEIRTTIRDVALGRDDEPNR
jgi:hypothetical protein